MKVSEKQHPFLQLGLKVGDEIWVRATIDSLSEPGTMGWRLGLITASSSDRTGSDNTICTDVAHIMTKEGKRYAQ